MSFFELVDLIAGALTGVVGWFVVRRGPRPVGWWLQVTAVAWLAGSFVPTLGVAHRAPLVGALLVGRYLSSSSAGRAAIVTLVGAGAATLWWHDPRFTAALGLGLILAESTGWSPPGASTLRFPGCAYGVVLVLVAASQLAGTTPSDSAAVAYSIAVGAIVIWVGVLAGRSATERLVIELASTGSGDSLEQRLRIALDDPGLTLVLSSTPPRQMTADATTALRRSGALVGYLNHRNGLRLDPNLVAGLGAIAGLAADALALRAAAAEADAEIERAAGDLAETRRRESIVLAGRVREGPAVALDRALERVCHLPVATQLRAARRELLAVAEGLAPFALAEEGLRAALAQRAMASPVPVEIVVDEDLRLATDLAYAVFLICSEALANAIKHAGARSIRIRVTAGAVGLEAEVADDGRGGAQRDGSGLRGLVERASTIGGVLTIDSPAAGGTRVHLVVGAGGGA